MTTDYQTLLNLPYAPSAYQIAVFDWIVDGRGHGVVEAVAGSGKTATIVAASNLIKGDGLFVAFNKTIADMLAFRLPNMECKTFHALGFSAIRSAMRGTRVQVDNRKYRNILREYQNEARSGSLFGRPLSENVRFAIGEKARQFPFAETIKVLNLARLNLIDPDADKFASALTGLVDHHALEIDPTLLELTFTCVRRLMLAGKANVAQIDFTDMVWLPTVNGYKLPSFSWVFIDECQDMSKATLALALAACRKGGRILAVGDRKQAINGFAGADARSFQNILEQTNATVLPLSICYRCPTSVVALAKQYCPQIEARPEAPEGVVRRINETDFASNVHEGDMVLCRINAPLVGMCYALIADGIAATVRGRSIGEDLCKIVDEVEKKTPDFGYFHAGMTEWYTQQERFLRRRFDDEDLLAEALERVQDQAECVRIIFGRSAAKNARELKSAIDELFSDDRSSVVLSSVHKAKGLEARRVFIAKPSRLGSGFRCSRDWMLEQERNLAYVAVTRAQDELVFVDD